MKVLENLSSNRFNHTFAVSAQNGKVYVTEGSVHSTKPIGTMLIPYSALGGLIKQLIRARVATILGISKAEF